MSAKIEVHLTPKARCELASVARSQTVSAFKAQRARVLLLADEDHADCQRPDTYIAAALGLSEKQVKVIRQKFVREGLPALERKQRFTPATPPRLDGRAEARLVALCCSTPPDGRQRWTLQLQVDELCRLRVVTSVCRETVRKCLKKPAPALADAAVLHPGKGPGTVCRAAGTGPRCLLRTVRRGASADLHG